MPQDQIVSKKIPLLGVLTIVYGLFVLGFVPVVAKIYHMSGADDRIMLDSTIVVLSLLLMSHFSLYKIQRGSQFYKWKIITWIGVVFSYFVLINCAVNVVFKPMIYEQRLKSVLTEVDHIKVMSGAIVVKNFGTSEAENVEDWLLFEETDKVEIQKVIDNIKIIPYGYGFSCMCGGHQKIQFYQGDQLVVEVTFHHGKSLRWLKHWPSDMSLTNDSVFYLKNWLSRNDVEDFE